MNRCPIRGRCKSEFNAERFAKKALNSQRSDQTDISRGIPVFVTITLSEQLVSLSQNK